MANWTWTGGIKLGSGGQTITTGSGDPTGAVSAPIGSLYLRIDGGVSLALYVKEAGVGNAGWTAYGAGGGGGSSSLATLTDVSLTSLVTGQVLTWNGTHWTNEATLPITGTAAVDIFNSTTQSGLYIDDPAGPNSIADGFYLQDDTGNMTIQGSSAQHGIFIGAFGSGNFINLSIGTSSLTLGAGGSGTFSLGNGGPGHVSCDSGGILSLDGNQININTGGAGTNFQTLAIFQAHATFQSEILDNSSSAGTAGQVLQSTGTGVQWGGQVQVNNQSASYQPVMSDANQLVVQSSASANNFTIPANVTVGFPIGTILSIIQYGAGQVTLVAAGGVTLVTPSGTLTTRAQYSTISVVQIAANIWIAGGDLT